MIARNSRIQAPALHLLPPSTGANAKRLLLGKALRAIADGYVSMLLPAYLLELGLSTFRVGVITTATLLGSAALTLLTGFITSRFGLRRPLVAASGGCHATRAAGCGRSHLGPPEPCFRRKPDDRRLSAQPLELWLAAAHRRHPENRLRPDPADHVPAYPAPGRSTS